MELKAQDLPGEGFGDVTQALEAGILLLGEDGAAGFGNAQALALLGCADRRQLEGRWSDLRSRLESAGLRFGREAGSTARATLDLSDGDGTRRVLFEHYANGHPGSVLVLRDAAVLGSLEDEIRLAAQMQALSYVTPAVAHDLRAPINAMVFNIEILKETLAAGRGGEPAIRERQLRYVSVLKEELNRLHQSLEIYLAQVTPRGDRAEDWDLREALADVVALIVPQARKQQSRVELDPGIDPVLLGGSRYRLKQSLLLVAIAALAGVPRDQALEIGLAAEDERAVVVFEGSSAEGDSGAPAPRAPGFALRLEGERATALYVARSILAGYGAELRWVPGEGNRFEIEFPFSGKE